MEVVTIYSMFEANNAITYYFFKDHENVFVN